MYHHTVLGIMLMLVGVASTGFHWSRKDCWHTLDIVMIYYMLAVVGSWLWFDNVGIVVGVTVGIIAHASFKNYSRYSQQIIGALGAYTLLAFYLQHGLTETLHVLAWFASALLCGGLASYFQPDEDGQLYDWLHSWWHIGSGIGLYYLIMT